jgi:hypothetical protein
VSEGRVVHLDVTTNIHLDGQSEVSVTLTETPHGDYVVEVRPKGKRLVYKGLLSDVAAIVAARHAKWLAQQQGIAVPQARKGRR